jgi:ribosomal subunit interface protein
MEHGMSRINIEVTTRGEVSEHARAQAREKVRGLERYVKEPILGARIVLITQRNPRIPEPARAEAEIDLRGRVIRAHADGPTVEAAVDEVVERLARQLRRFLDRRITRRRESAEQGAREPHT